MTTKQPYELIRKKDLKKYVPLGSTQIDELIANDPDFPKPIKLSDSGRAIAWLAPEIEAWQARRIATRDEALAAKKQWTT